MSEDTLQKHCIHMEQPVWDQATASLLLLAGIGGYVWLKRRKAAKAAAPAVA